MVTSLVCHGFTVSSECAHACSYWAALHARVHYMGSQSSVITYKENKRSNVSATTVAFIRDEYKNQNFISENALRTHSSY